MSVEFMADGSVGAVKIVKGLGPGIDENVIRATRQNLFLPAVKDGAFVSEWTTTQTKFADKWRN